MLKYDVDQQKRMTFYRMMIMLAVMIAGGRIASVISREGDTAFLSANDRSRWCAVASLVEDGTYAIDRQVAIRGDKGRQPWNTIDKVRHRGPDDRMHYYSSKPPLFTTLVAGVYAVVNRASGMTMTDQPIYVPRMVLAIVNLPMLIVFCWFTILVIERLGVGEWPRCMAALTTCFGTMLFPFTITLNNHLPAAMSTAVVMYLYLLTAHELRDEFNGGIHSVSKWSWLGGGLAAGFAAANELPALSMFAFWAVMLAMLDWKSLVWFALGGTIVAAGFFGTNYLAHDSLRPPYAHRGEGAEIATLASTDQVSVADVMNALVQKGEIKSGESLEMRRSDTENRLIAETQDERLFAVMRQDDPGLATSTWKIYQWDDWYDYPGTYWRGDKRRGVDLGEPSRLAYLMHLTIGHHGIFSLTPIWFLLPVGLACALAYAQRDFRIFAVAVMAATVVCIVFYVMRPTIDRNYGGVSCCFRWMLWFTPLWIVVCMPAFNECGESPRARWLTTGLLAISIFSAATALHSPWQSPWLYRFWSFLGWIAT